MTFGIWPVWLMVMAVASPRETICRFSATGSPEDQGWVAKRSGTSPTAGLVVAGPSEEGPAWQIRDDSNEPGALVYSRRLSNGEWARLAKSGWRLTALVRVVSCDVPADNEERPESTAQLELVPGPGDKGIRLAFSLTGKEHRADGEATVIGVDGRGIHELGQGYHKVEAMVRPAANGQVDIKVRFDGHSRYSGMTSPDKLEGGPCLRWGSFGSDGCSVVNWREIRLETLLPGDMEIPGAKRQSDFDYTGFARHFGATFDIDAPRGISNVPLGKCAELGRWGTPVALTRPRLNNMDNYFEFYFALRRPPEYLERDDVEIYVTYRHDGTLASVLVHGDLIRRHRLPYQYDAEKRGEEMAGAKDLAAEIRRRMASALSDGAEDPFYRAMPRAIEECIVAVDAILVGHK